MLALVSLAPMGASPALAGLCRPLPALAGLCDHAAAIRPLNEVYRQIVLHCQEKKTPEKPPFIQV